MSQLDSFDQDGNVIVIVETPRGSRNKYAYSGRFGGFELKGVLPEGTSFPYDFGFVPGTQGEDGDPLDILLLLDAAAFPGCVVATRLIGAIEAEQRERDGTWERNDRLIGVASHARAHEHVTSLADLPKPLIPEIEAFFAHYNRLHGKEFRPLGRCDGKAALALLEKGRSMKKHAAEGSG